MTARLLLVSVVALSFRLVYGQQPAGSPTRQGGGLRSLHDIGGPGPALVPRHRWKLPPQG